MTIKNITIYNFQSYYDTTSIEFGDGLNLIIGNGGKGKSKLFNAFYWVLFGKIYITGEGWCSTDGLPYSARLTMQKHEYFNKKALHEAKTGERVVCRVTLELIDDKGAIYQIERSASAERQAGQDWNSVFGWNVSANSLKVIYDVKTGTKTLADDFAEVKIAELFPEGIRGYIWFQGESLDSLIDFRKKENLKDAVKHISYYPYYEKQSAIIALAKKKIEQQESKKLKEANKQNTETKGLLIKLDYLRGKLETEEQNKERLEGQISQVQIALFSDESKVSGLANFTNLVKSYDDCELKINRINNELTAIDYKQRELLPSLWMLRGTENMIERSKAIIAAHVEEEQAVPEKKYLDNPSRSKLEEILRDGVCFVCGSKVDKDHQHAVDYIMNRIRMQDEYLREMEEYTNNMEQAKMFNMFVGKIQDYPDSLLVALGSIDKQYSKMEGQMDVLMIKRKKLHEKKFELDKEIEDIKAKYGVDPHKQAEQAPLLASSIKASRSTLSSLQKKLKACENSISEYNSQIKEVERDLKGQTYTSGAVTTVAETEWKLISMFLETISKTVQEKARKELLIKIEKRSNEFYERFTEHDKGYKGRVEIGSDYSIQFDPGLNTSHEDRKKMSIINALLSLNQEAIGTYYPFISDAPTSSFDPSTTHKYLKGVKDIFGQTIIMTKDVEVGSDSYHDLFSERKVSHIYQLNSKIYREDGGEPEIYEVSTTVERLK